MVKKKNKKITNKQFAKKAAKFLIYLSIKGDVNMTYSEMSYRLRDFFKISEKYADQIVLSAMRHER